MATSVTQTGCLPLSNFFKKKILPRMHDIKYVFTKVALCMGRIYELHLYVQCPICRDTQEKKLFLIVYFVWIAREFTHLHIWVACMWRKCGFCWLFNFKNKPLIRFWPEIIFSKIHLTSVITISYNGNNVRTLSKNGQIRTVTRFVFWNFFVAINYSK